MEVCRIRVRTVTGAQKTRAWIGQGKRATSWGGARLRGVGRVAPGVSVCGYQEERLHDLKSASNVGISGLVYGNHEMKNES